MTSIARTNKAAGGTSFTAATTILASEVNGDFDAIFSDHNGSITDFNLSASADIAESKIADHGTLATQTTPGFDGSSAPTTLAGEIERLRYALATLKFGNATDQTAAVAWYDRSLNLLSNPRNIIRNGSFELYTGTTAPEGWAATGTPATTIATETNVAADGIGQGYRLKITGAGAAATGITQTLAAGALRPSTTYIVTAMAKATTGDFARMFTADADVEMDVETAETGFTLLRGFFTTDATPAPVVLTLCGKNASDIVWFDHVCVVPMVSTSRESGYVAVSQVLEVPTGVGTGDIDDTDTLGANGDTADVGADWTDATNTLQRAVVVPGSGYMLKVTARLGYMVLNADTTIRARLLEKIDAGSFTQRDGVSKNSQASSKAEDVFLQYLNTAPTPGSLYTFKVTGSINSGSFRPQGAAADNINHTKSSLLVELIPTGG